MWMPWLLGSLVGPALVGPAYGADARVVDRIAAVVNDEVIALSEVYEIGSTFVSQRCPASESGPDPECVLGAENEVLDSLIRRMLIRQELTRLQLDVTAADVDQAIDRTVQQYQLADRAALRTEVEASGKRWDEYRDELMEFLRTQAFQARILAPRVTVTEDEMRDLYQRTMRKVVTPGVRLSGFGIGVPPDATPEQQAEIETQAEQLVASLNAGEIPWDEAVRLYDAGLAGLFQERVYEPGELVEPLGGAVFAPDVPIGVVLPPVRMRMPSGVDVLFLLRVDEKSSRSEVAPFEDVKDQLRDQVFSEKLADAEEEWYQRARREAAIDVKLKAS